MLIGSILLAIALVEFLLGLYFIFRYERQQSTLWFGLFCIGSAIYVGANGLGGITNQFFIGERFSWVGGMIATSMFLPFSATFPIPRRSIRELLPWVIWPVTLFTIGLLASDTFIFGQGTTHYRVGYQTAPGQLFWFMVATLVVYWIWSLSNLMSAYRTSDGIFHRNLKLILGGIFVSLAVSVSFDIVLPLVTSSQFGYVGSLFTSAWLGVTSYIILKR